MILLYAWFFICLGLTIFYCMLMWFYRSNWLKIPEIIKPGNSVSTAVTIIIPARNEAKNIGQLLKDISQQHYPEELLEIIVIDDHSEDNTVEIASSFPVKVYKLQDLLPQSEITEVYKKRAIELAVQKAKGTLIVTTDADCRVQSTWLKTLVNFYETTDSKLIAGPVMLFDDLSLFEHFQALDFCGMQLITGASLQSGIYNMANGANLAFEKEAFLKVDGYKGIDKQASGDDMLLVHKIANQYSGAVRFLKSKDAIVGTSVMHTFSEFLQQRFRWTSKSASYQDKRMTLILGLVYLFVLTAFINLSVAVTTASPVAWTILVMQLFFKSVADYFFLRTAVLFFGREKLLRTFFSSEILHCWYIVFVGTLGNIMPYRWKGRKLR